ncbi:MAG: hypothetical protein EA350_14290 [Gemmatimonadales bacterium]|nr:MAG: hypothetical protein EA350_14290 [Gemmatimonadales bacterium]
MTSEARVRIVLQARTGSSRLPAKSLLPVGGIPLVLLCAQRLGQDGLEVVVATSDHEDDDLLAHTLERKDVRVVRGSLSDVLGRFILATADLDDSDLAVRVTGDNPLPDADFVRRLLRLHQDSGMPCIFTHSPRDGLPYGLSAEVLTVGLLRHAGSRMHDVSDREHVTTWVRSEYPGSIASHRDFGLPDLSDFRCTVDTLEDYLAVAKLFDCPHPVSVPWSELAERLVSAGKRTSGGDMGWLVLGTAQLGMDYGITNIRGKPSEHVAFEVVRKAIAAGVRWIDTAASYGDAETRTGRAVEETQVPQMQFVTKVPPQRGAGISTSGSVYRSLFRLRTRALAAALLHDWDDFKARGGEHWMALKELRREGIVDRIGVSVYDPEQAMTALDEPSLGHLQIPVNILDRRWDRPDVEAAFEARPDVTVHARSVFLQGLLLGNGERWPLSASRGTGLLSRLDDLAPELGRRNRLDLCLAYVRGLPWVDAAVIGVQDAGELDETLALASTVPLSGEEVDLVRARLGDVPTQLLDPRRWSNA